MSDGLVAVVAQGEEGADGEMLIEGTEMDVHVEVSEGDGLALGVFGGGGVGDFDGGWGGGRTGLGGGLAVLVGGTREDNFAAGCSGSRRGELGGGGGGFLGRRGVSGGLGGGGRDAGGEQEQGAGA